MKHTHTIYEYQYKKRHWKVVYERAEDDKGKGWRVTIRVIPGTRWTYDNLTRYRPSQGDAEACIRACHKELDP